MSCSALRNYSTAFLCLMLGFVASDAILILRYLCSLFFLSGAELFKVCIANFLNRQMLKSELTKQMLISFSHKVGYSSSVHLVTQEFRLFPSCNATISTCGFQVNFDRGRKTWEERHEFLIALAQKCHITSAHDTWQKNT